MKKAIFILFLMTAVFLCGTVLADGVYEKPILFRGLEWGAPYRDVMAAYAEGYESDWDPTGLDAMFFGGAANHYGTVGFSVRSSVPDGKPVAGYDVNDIYLNFVYTPDETGLLAKDKDHAVLCFARYRLDFASRKENYDAALEDLKNKLTRVYGDVDSEPSQGYGSRAVWKGADGTLVSLYCFRGSYLSGGNYYVIEIQYSFEGMEALLQDAKKALDMEFSTLTDGL